MSDKPTYNLDAFQNEVSGMGMGGCDKNVFSTPTGQICLGQQTLDALYAGDWLAAKICNRPANDATRRWITADISVLDRLAELDVQNQCRDAMAWGRLYGGSALALVVEDGKDPSEPLDPRAVRRLVAVVAVDRYHLVEQEIEMDPSSPVYGRPRIYQWNGGPRYHRSRIVQFAGAPLTFDQRATNGWWGGSYVSLYYDAVRNLQSAYQEVMQTLSESNIGVLKVPGLTQKLAMGGTIMELMNKRLSAFNRSKSGFKTAMMDKEEDFSFVSRTLAGIPDVLDRFMTQTSAASEIPELVLFGKSPSGLNASQEEQLAVYDDMVVSLQELQLTPAINKILLCEYGGKLPDWEYKPLRTPTPSQAADNRLKDAQTLQIISDAVGMTPEAAVAFLNSTGNFDLDIEADGEELPENAQL